MKTKGIPNRKIVMSEITDEDEANKINDTQPGGGTFDYGEDDDTIEMETEGAIDRDLAARIGLDPDAFDDDVPDFDDIMSRGDDDDDDDGADEPDYLDDPRNRYMAEAGYDAQFVPPWSPVPTAVGKKWVEKNQDAQIDIVFPTVYEEDRTAKIKDLGTANALGTISHQRMAEQMAKELGFEQYDYKDEMQQVKIDAKAVGPTAVGVADDLASTVMGIPVQPGGTFSPRSTKKMNVGPGGGSTGPQPINAPAPSLAADSGMGNKHADAPDPYDNPKRADLAGTQKAKFRDMQRTQAQLGEAIGKAVGRAVGEAMRGMSERLIHLEESIAAARPVIVQAPSPTPAPPAPDVTVNIEKPDPPIVNVEASKIPAPEVNVTVEREGPPPTPVVHIENPPTQPKRVVKDVIHDKYGRISRIIESEE